MKRLQAVYHVCQLHVILYFSGLRTVHTEIMYVKCLCQDALIMIVSSKHEDSEYSHHYVCSFSFMSRLSPDH